MSHLNEELAKIDKELNDYAVWCINNTKVKVDYFDILNVNTINYSNGNYSQILLDSLSNYRDVHLFILKKYNSIKKRNLNPFDNNKLDRQCYCISIMQFYKMLILIFYEQRIPYDKVDIYSKYQSKLEGFINEYEEAYSKQYPSETSINQNKKEEEITDEI